MALLSGAAGVYTELIMKKRPQRDVNVQNVFLYTFGVLFNFFAMIAGERDVVWSKGFFHGFSAVVSIMVINHALSGIAVSFVMKFANNLVKVYSTSVAMILTTFVSIAVFDFEPTLPFFLGSGVVSVAIYLHNLPNVDSC